MIDSITIDCPYCGEAFDTGVDCSAGSQQYVEDCPVCCAPIELRLDVDTSGRLTRVEARRENE